MLVSFQGSGTCFVGSGKVVCSVEFLECESFMVGSTVAGRQAGLPLSSGSWELTSAPELEAERNRCGLMWAFGRPHRMTRLLQGHASSKTTALDLS